MRRLYNDIIYFLQNHVEPVVPTPVATTTTASCRLVELGSTDSDTSARTWRPRGDDEAPVKLFGVRLNDGKKRRAQQVVPLEGKGDGDQGESIGDGDHNGHG
jgi:heat shock transcription factor